MTLSRRRFLAISAAAMVSNPACARTARWNGVALGADASIELAGPDPEAAISAVLELVREVERVFSLYDPGSSLSRLNRDGRLSSVPEMMAQVFSVTSRIHVSTGGAFDPTVQALWNPDADDGRHLVDWKRVAFEGGAIRLAKGQALTFNGIAQGYATDLAVEELHRRAYRNALVNIGEHRGIGGPWRLGLSDPSHGLLGTRTLTDGAIATSSPSALRLSDGAFHIQNPTSSSPPLWSTASVEAESATIADAFSTAACLMPVERVREAMGALPGIRRVTLVDEDGRLRTMT